MEAESEWTVHIQLVASLPGVEEGEEKAPGMHCSHMHVIIAKAMW